MSIVVIIVEKPLRNLSENSKKESVDLLIKNL